MATSLKELKQTEKIQSLLVLDPKGFQIHNSGFTQTHNLHALHQLSEYFFPGSSQNTIVGVQTVSSTVVLRRDKQGRLIGIKQPKGQ